MATPKTEQLQADLKKTTDDAVALVKNTAETAQKGLTDAAGDVKASAQKIFLAGLGAFAMAEEEGSKLFKKLVKKGEKLDLKGFAGDPIEKVRKQLDSSTDKVTEAVKGRAQDARYMAGEAAATAEDRLQDAVAAVMKRVGVPTREEIAELTTSVERLTKHIEKLKKERAATPATPVLEAVGGGWYEVKVGDVVVEKVQGKEDAEAALVRLQAQQH